MRMSSDAMIGRTATAQQDQPSTMEDRPSCERFINRLTPREIEERAVAGALAACDRIARRRAGQQWVSKSRRRVKIGDGFLTRSHTAPT
jgi:hypothetical protein